MIKESINNNDGIVAVVIFLIGAPVAYLLKRLFDRGKANRIHQQQKGGDHSVNMQVGRDINVNK